MNNKVKPQAGQVWQFKSGAINSYEAGYRITLRNKDSELGFMDAMPVNFVTKASLIVGVDFLYKYFEFVPQGDLEWLTVNVNASNCYISRTLGGYSTALSADLINACHSPIFTKQQWQECRYKLGLDERPIKEGGVMSREQKVIDQEQHIQGKMVMDLSDAVIGNKFEAGADMLKGAIFELVVKGDKDCVFKESGSHHVSNMDGVIIKGVVELVKKHDPRLWLKLIPNASVFEFYGAVLLTFKSTAGWYITLDDGCTVSVPAGKIPSLKEGNSILIADLAKWQAENK